MDTAAPGQAYPDGGGLYLRVSENGNRKWELRYKSPLTGKRVDMGLGNARKGTAGYVTLAGAREAAERARALVAKGLDPVAEREREKAERAAQAAKVAPLTFGKFAEDWMDQNLEQHKNAKHRAQWRSTMRQHAEPLWNKPLDAISTEDVLNALKPIWGKTPETARRTQGRIEIILDAARAAGQRHGENPARWRGHLALLLPKRPKARHQPAMAHQDIPAFMLELRKRSSVSARALEFLILTAARSGEVRGMTWAELDQGRTTWTVPEERMKAGIAHRVPLTDRAREILQEMEKFRSADRPDTALVFPGQRGRRAKSDHPALSDMTLTQLLRGMRELKGAEHESLRKMLIDASGNPVVVHGFRSTFRDWAEDVARFPARVVEHALAHTIRDKAEAAYRRGDALDQRRELMAAWETYLDTIR
ncbi:integrase [Microcystis phage Mwe-Yong1]|nr:integrase [Microcystis phage Mwe-Yong1]